MYKYNKDEINWEYIESRNPIIEDMNGKIKYSWLHGITVTLDIETDIVIISKMYAPILSSDVLLKVVTNRNQLQQRKKQAKDELERRGYTIESIKNGYRMEYWVNGELYDSNKCGYPTYGYYGKHKPIVRKEA